MLLDILGTLLANGGTLLLGMGVFLGLRFFMMKYRHRNRKSPPGLPRIPVVGSLPWLAAGVNHLTFTKFAQKYGKIYTVDFGRRRAVVLNDRSSIQEALVKQAVIFADRPSFSPFRSVNPEDKGIIDARFDGTFVRNKQTSLAVLHDLGIGRNVMEGQILSEIGPFLDALARQKAKAFDPADLFYASVSNIICSVLFSKRFNYEDARFRKALRNVRELTEQFGVLISVDFVPLLNLMPSMSGKINTIAKLYGETLAFVEEELREHSNNSYSDENERDFISAFRHKMANNLDPESVKFIVVDCFGAGGDTTSTTLRWAMIYMANNPDVQSRVHQEIADVMGEGRPPSMSDRTSMKYTDAVVLEILRKSSIAALGLPHRLAADTELQGFFLEKGTMVNINIWAVHHDPDVWPDPDRFDPGRFLDNQGHVTGRERIIPFGLGRRSCLGEALARQELFLYFTSILQRFQVLPPPGQDKLPEEGVFGSVLSPIPHMVVFKPR